MSTSIVLGLCYEFSLSQYLARPVDQRVIWLFEWFTLMVIHDSDKCFSHRYCGSGDGFSMPCDLARPHD